MVTAAQRVTADDLWELAHAPECDGQRLELSRGELIVMAPAGGEHGRLAFDASFFVGGFVKAHNLGYVTAAETGYILFTDPDGAATVRAPDVAFVKRDRLPDGLPEGFIPLAPDLVIEVVSPNDRAEAVETKLDDYLRAGVPLLWWIYPKAQTVIVYAGGTVQRLTLDDTLDGGAVLPGFTLPIRALFSR